MGYMHIDNLYKNQDILVFKECYALEKIHGTSAHIAYKADEHRIIYFAGGASYNEFVKLFDEQVLLDKAKEIGVDFVVYGEAYGGKMQGMKDVYGDKLKFVAFDVRIRDLWLAVPNAEGFVRSLGLEFVFYERISTDLESLNRARDRESMQAIRNGVGENKESEGVILRPIVEFRKNNDERIISKHKRENFRETKTPRQVDPGKLKVLEEATAVADEWVTHMRLTHVQDKLQLPYDMSHTREFINAMVEDVKREGEGEIVWSKEVEAAIGKKTSALLKAHINQLLKATAS